MSLGRTSLDGTELGGSVGGYAPLDSGLKIPAEYFSNNDAATDAPTINDDSGDGYVVGSLWTDVTHDLTYVCLDASVGAAVWHEIARGTPRLYGVTGAYAGSGTTVAVTTTAFPVGSNLVAFVFSSRTADSISQTNVTWTLRYSGNGNGQFLTVWTGVVSGGASGTTATVNLTGSGVQYAMLFALPDEPPITAAALSGSSTTAATTALATAGSGNLTRGAVYCWFVSATAAATAYSGCTAEYDPVLSPFGGAGRMGVFRARSHSAGAWSMSSSAVNFFAGIIGLS